MRRFTVCCLVGIAWIGSQVVVLAEGEVEELICGDGDLAVLDRGLDEVFKAAMAAVDEDQQKLLRAEQRGWIKGRNDCWKEGPVPLCLRRQPGHRDRGHVLQDRPAHSPSGA